MRAKSGSRKKPPPGPTPVARPSSAWPLVGTAGRGLFALAIVAGVMAAVVWVGGRTGRVVAPRDRYSVNFLDIQTPTPPSGDRTRFLLEVRYLDDLPERVQSVDPNLVPRLRHAFGKHPWVEAVEAIEVTPDNQVRVGLVFRQPVLAVMVVGEPGPRLIDRAGVLLPGESPTPLPTLVTPQPPPPTPPGQVWANQLVRFSATLAVTYRPKTVERTRLGIKLTFADGRVQNLLWNGA